MTAAWKPCPHAGPDGPCHELINKQNPCPVHGRPVNAPWSPDRDRKAHDRLRRLVLKQRGPRCEFQGCTFETTPDGRGLHMHHLKPVDEPEAVVLLCPAHHREVDRHAR